MTNEQLHQDFLKDFKELLEKYEASFKMVSDIIDGSVPSIVFPAKYDDETDKLVRDYSTFDLPTYLNPN